MGRGTACDNRIREGALGGNAWVEQGMPAVCIHVSSSFYTSDAKAQPPGYALCAQLCSEGGSIKSHSRVLVCGSISNSELPGGGTNPSPLKQGRSVVRGAGG